MQPVALNPVQRQTPLDLSRVATVEVGTGLFLFALGLLFARPQLEGWDLLSSFRAQGVMQAVPQYWSAAPTRWFEPIPVAIAWCLGHGAGWAVGAVYGAELVAKFSLVRWGLSSTVQGSSRWCLSTLGALMVPWSGEWRAHNMAQQLSAVFLLLAFAALARAGRRLGWGASLLAALGVFLSLVTYEGLLLCIPVLPIAVAAMNGRRTLGEFVRLAAPVAAGILAFVATSGLIVAYSGTAVYQSRGIDVHGLSDLARRVGLLFDAVYGRGPAALGLMVVVVGGLAATAVPESSRLRVLGSAVPLVFLLPILSFPYLDNVPHAVDVERVAFPVGFGFFLLCGAVAARNSSQHLRSPVHAVVVCGLLAVATFDAYESNQPYRLQRTVIDSIGDILTANPGKTARVRDWSGLLGDKYTFMFPGTLQSALAVRGLPSDVDLCTMRDVELVHPELNRAGWLSIVPRCEAETGASRSIVIDVRRATPDGALTVTRPVGVTTVVAEGSIGGAEGQLTWINDPAGSIELHNNGDAPTDATWTAVLTPPPCPGQSVALTLSLDGAAVPISFDAPLNESLPVHLDANETKRIRFAVSSPVCHLVSGDTRPFYLGLIGMQIKPSP